MTTRKAGGLLAMVLTGMAAVAYAQGIRIEPGALRVAGNMGVGSAPSATRRVTVSGSGEVGVADSGNKSATLLIASTGGGGGDGGAIEFGFGLGTYGQPYYAAIKGHGTNGASNTAGDVVILTRTAATDTSLTERLRVSTTGAAVTGDFSVSTRIQTGTQPNFTAYNSVSDAGVSSGATVEFDTEDFDQGSNFASNTFTAPVTGKYHFCVQGRTTNGTDAGNLVLYIGSIGVFTTPMTPVNAGFTIFQGSSCVSVPMTAADTAVVRLQDHTGTQTVFGSTGGRWTRFSGYLMP